MGFICRKRLDRPIGRRDGETRYGFRAGFQPVALEELLQHRRGFGPGLYGPGVNKGGGQARGGIQGSQAAPAGIGQGLGFQLLGSCLRDDQVCLAAAQRLKETGRPGPITPGLGRHGKTVDIQIIQKTLARHPAAPAAGVHHLHPAGMLIPGDHEVGQFIGEAHHHQGRQGIGFFQEQVVGRQHHLLGLQAQLDGQVFQRINGGAIHRGLAGLAQAPIAGVNAEAFQDGLEGSRAAVHLGGLHDLRDEETPGNLWRIPGGRSHIYFPNHCPADCQTISAGETAPTRTLTRPLSMGGWDCGAMGAKG